jgi:uncharacterized protein
MEHLLGYMLALVIGLTLGLLGAGGSIITVPVFAYVLGYPPKEAIAMSLAVVGATSAFGAVGHVRRGSASFRTAVLFGGVAMAGAFIGAKLSVHFPGVVQLVLLAAIMLPAAFFMARPARIAPPPTEESRRRERLLTVAVGLGIGMLTGLAGVGGGFMILPALVLLLGCPMKKAVGTSLIVIAMNSLTAFVGYLGSVPVRWPVIAIFSALAIVGIMVAAPVGRRTPEPMLRKAFATLLVVVAVYIFYQNRDALSQFAASGAGSPVSASARGAASSPSDETNR